MCIDNDTCMDELDNWGFVETCKLSCFLPAHYSQSPRYASRISVIPHPSSRIPHPRHPPSRIPGGDRDMDMDMDMDMGMDMDMDIQSSNFAA
jgi:hypothetical protein